MISNSNKMQLLLSASKVWPTVPVGSLKNENHLKTYKKLIQSNNRNGRAKN